ncbi:MAG: S-methyl-5-thioribose-1-phosphate isomerase, partial [Lentisphaerae bacterium]|nr:S-methyl-5-thioribose-1-phosphate isomerase [Lentisphaerota bacterium]
MQTVRPIEWLADSPGRLVPGRIRLIDQTLLPLETKYLETVDVREMWTAIKELKVRGAPAIGIAAAMALAASIQGTDASTTQELLQQLERDADYLATSRPTAVNLAWAVDLVAGMVADHEGTPAQIASDLAVA